MEDMFTAGNHNLPHLDEFGNIGINFDADNKFRLQNSGRGPDE
jgi:hypothetical protein